jgi:hypothetical protein
LDDKNDNSCHTVCSNKNHYEPSDKKCIVKPCLSRISNLSDESTNYPCGPGSCYVDQNDENNCVEVCRNANYYGVSPTGNHVCTEKDCSNRPNNGSNHNPCGSSECYLDVNAGSIYVNQCTYLNLYEQVEEICVLRNCIDREPLNGTIHVELMDV